MTHMQPEFDSAGNPQRLWLDIRPEPLDKACLRGEAGATKATEGSDVENIVV